MQSSVFFDPEGDRGHSCNAGVKPIKGQRRFGALWDKRLHPDHCIEQLPLAGRVQLGAVVMHLDGTRRNALTDSLG
ncbi:MAG: hypothetical protein KatS3mg104_1536 [Phycisphaerae bacterium]|nr:MAG: hypothetical protein KatS3mg104_1536 [Phycisphaerae bacterium]